MFLGEDELAAGLFDETSSPMRSGVGWGGVGLGKGAKLLRLTPSCRERKRKGDGKELKAESPFRKNKKSF